MQCERIAARVEEKMRLDYEMIRMKECASLMQKGFMVRPGTDFYPLCADVIPISTYLAEVEAKKPKPPTKKPWWHISNPLKKKT